MEHLTKPIPGMEIEKNNKKKFIKNKSKNYYKHNEKYYDDQETLASWWKRLGSLMIDIIIMSIILNPFSKLLPTKISLNTTYTTNNYLIALLVITYFFIYTIITEYLIGQTIGMIIFNIKIKNEKKTYKIINNNITIINKKNETITLWQIIIRNLFLIPIFPFTLLWIIDPLYLLLTKTRLSEKWSKTKTI